MTITIRPAQPSDADQMCDLLNKIITIGGTTAHRTPFDPARMQADYIAHPRGISCVVAQRDDQILGFQSLEWCDPDWQGDPKLPSDWGVIASFVAHGAHGMGIGTKLFAATLNAARNAGVRVIDATIRRENSGGLTYYSKMGFVDYRASDLALSKRYDLN